MRAEKHCVDDKEIKFHNSVRVVLKLSKGNTKYFALIYPFFMNSIRIQKWTRFFIYVSIRNTIKSVKRKGMFEHYPITVTDKWFCIRYDSLPRTLTRSLKVIQTWMFAVLCII